MTERVVETVARRDPQPDRHPKEKPRIISGQRPRFIARDVKECTRVARITLMRTTRNARDPAASRIHGVVGWIAGALAPRRRARWRRHGVRTRRKSILTTSCGRGGQPIK